MTVETLKKAIEVAIETLQFIKDADSAGATPAMVVKARSLYVSTQETLISALERVGPLADEREILISALSKLSKLGNGEREGNSIGNCIAQEALRKVGLIPEPSDSRNRPIKPSDVMSALSLAPSHLAFPDRCKWISDKLNSETNS